MIIYTSVFLAGAISSALLLSVCISGTISDLEMENAQLRKSTDDVIAKLDKATHQNDESECVACIEGGNQKEKSTET